MLSSETEEIVALFLLQLSEIERKVETSRESLNACRDFSLRSAFNSIDIHRSSYITPERFQVFLSGFSYGVSLEETSLLISQYDQDKDGYISFEEFLTIVLSFENPELRIECEERTHAISEYALKSLADHLVLCIDLQKDIEYVKQALHKRWDFTPYKVFSVLSNSDAQRIEEHHLTDFLSKFQDLNAINANRITRRIGFAGSISYLNLSEALGVRSVRRTLFPDIVSLVECQLEQVKKLENVRKNLADQPDFTLLDFFRMIDLEDKGFITLNDLDELFLTLGLEFDLDDVFLLFKRYKSTNQIQLNDFESMWMPYDKLYRNTLRDRVPLLVPPEDRTKAFSEGTLRMIILALELYVQSERHIECSRKSLLGQHSVIDLFKTIDLRNDGYITSSELKAFLNEYYIEVSHQDTKMLLKLYDKNKDGRISYSDFYEEIAL